MDENKMAFPTTDGINGNGMSLREWYAGMALQALISNNVELNRVLDRFYNSDDRTSGDCWEYLSCEAFGYADAMIKQLKD